jgi:hypothetical protein
MDEISGSFYKMSRHKNGNMTLCCVEIEGIPNETTLYRKLHTIVDCYPTLQHIPIERKGYFKSTFHWKKTEFNIQDHFTHIAKKRFDKRNFRHWINKTLNVSFSKNIPEWMCYYLSYEKSNKSFIVWKCNHTYGDGFLISEYLKKFADFSSISYPRKKRKSTSIWTKIYSFIVTIISLIYFIFRYKKQDLPIDKKDAEEDKALFYHCKTWDLQEIKKIKNHYDVSVNDLLYTIIIKALQKYCNKTIRLSSLSMFNLRDYRNDEDIVNIPPNDIGFMIVMNELDDGDPEVLLKKNHDKFSHYKSSPITYIITQFLRYLYSISPAMVVKILTYFSTKSTIGISNFQTFSTCNYIEGHRVVNISNMVVPYGVGSIFTIVSYDNKITLNITYRERNLKHPKKFITCLDSVYKTFSSVLKN